MSSSLDSKTMDFDIWLMLYIYIKSYTSVNGKWSEVSILEMLQKSSK